MQYSPMPQAKTLQNVHAVTFTHQFMIRGGWAGVAEAHKDAHEGACHRT